MSKHGEASDKGAGRNGPAVVLCEVFRSPRREGLYLYVKRDEGLQRVPESLLRNFGAPESALVFKLHAERPLARADAAEVLQALVDRGYFLQLPPAVDARRGDDPSAEKESSTC
jgi:uncharacterized protein YcgL (UPF0745 family)